MVTNKAPSLAGCSGQVPLSQEAVVCEESIPARDTRAENVLDICDSDPERKGRDMGMSPGRERPLTVLRVNVYRGCTDRVHGVSSLVYPFGFGMVVFVCVHVCTYISIPVCGNVYFCFLELKIALPSYFF